jgi:hypothetical protein
VQTLIHYTDDGVEGRRLVQVHRFPALRVRRTEDWGWVLGTRLSFLVRRVLLTVFDCVCW